MSDLIVNNFSNLLNVIIYDCKLSQDIFDALLYYSFYRSYLLLYIKFIWSQILCTSDFNIITLYQNAFQ